MATDLMLIICNHLQSCWFAIPAETLRLPQVHHALLLLLLLQGWLADGHRPRAQRLQACCVLHFCRKS
jgi:hypothetical protein